MWTYRFAIITVAESRKELREDDFDSIQKQIKKSLPQGMKLVAFDHELARSGVQMTMVEPNDSISSMVAKLKTK